VIYYDDFFYEEQKDGIVHEKSFNKSRTKDNINLSRDNLSRKATYIDRREIEMPIPEEDIITNEKNFINLDGQVNPLILENVRINSAKQNEVNQKRNQFADQKKVLNMKKNYIDNKPIVSKSKPYSPPQRKSIIFSFKLLQSSIFSL